MSIQEKFKSILEGLFGNNFNFDFSILLIGIFFLIVILGLWFYTRVGSLEDLLRKTILQIALIFFILIFTIENIYNHLNFIIIPICFYILYLSFNKIKDFEIKKENRLKKNSFAFFIEFSYYKQISTYYSKYIIKLFGLFKIKIYIIRYWVFTYLINIIVIILTIFNSLNLNFYYFSIILNLFLIYELFKNYIKYYSLIAVFLLLNILIFKIQANLNIVFNILIIMILIGIDWIDNVKLNEERKKTIEEYFSQ